MIYMIEIFLQIKNLNLQKSTPNETILWVWFHLFSEKIIIIQFSKEFLFFLISNKKNLHDLHKEICELWLNGVDQTTQCPD